MDHGSGSKKLLPVLIMASSFTSSKLLNFLQRDSHCKADTDARTQPGQRLAFLPKMPVQKDLALATRDSWRCRLRFGLGASFGWQMSHLAVKAQAS